MADTDPLPSKKKRKEAGMDIGEQEEQVEDGREVTLSSVLVLGIEERVSRKSVIAISAFRTLLLSGTSIVFPNLTLVSLTSVGKLLRAEKVTRLSPTDVLVFLREIQPYNLVWNLLNNDKVAEKKGMRTNNIEASLEVLLEEINFVSGSSFYGSITYNDICFLLGLYTEDKHTVAYISDSVQYDYKRRLTDTAMDRAAQMSLEQLYTILKPGTRSGRNKTSDQVYVPDYMRTTSVAFKWIVEHQTTTSPSDITNILSVISSYFMSNPRDVESSISALLAQRTYGNPLLDAFVLKHARFQSLHRGVSGSGCSACYFSSVSSEIPNCVDTRDQPLRERGECWYVDPITQLSCATVTPALMRCGEVRCSTHMTKALDFDNATYLAVCSCNGPLLTTEYSSKTGYLCPDCMHRIHDGKEEDE